MPRYYDLDKLKRLIETKAETLLQGNELLYYIARWLDLLPAADVAPKSEIASEIFAEIEKIIDRTLCLDINAYSAYEELKKKYTEEKE